jgi:hypothetical protein
VVNSNTIEDCKIIDLPKICSPSGNITTVENNIEIPFAVKRIYYLYDIPGGEERGGHGHKELQQLIIAASGSFDIILDDGNSKKLFHLNRPDFGILLPSGLWRELVNFSSGAICLVLASQEYQESDYIRNYSDFLIYKK